MAFYLGENKIAGMWVKDGIQNIIDVLPYGLNSFEIYAGGGIAYVNVPDSYRLGRRNFTVVKYFRSTARAVNSKFFELSSSNGDYFAVGNSGYTFAIDIKLGGDSILSYNVDSETVYDDGTLVDVFCCEVDYDRNEIRITSGNSFRKVISIPELTHIKGVDFENTTLFVNQYVYQCPYNFAVNCLIDYSMLSSFMNTDRTFPLQLIKNKGDISVIKTAPTGWGEYGNAVPFVGGVATIPSSYFDGFGTSNKYLLPAFNPIDDLPLYNDAHQYRFSMDIENGSFTFNSTSASAGLPRFRATNKDTGETIDYIGVSNANVMTLPPGRYLVEYYALTRIQYGNIRLIYPVGFGGIDSGATLKIYDDWEISPISVMTSAIARMANYNYVICPFSGQVGSGVYGLSDS